MSEHTPAMAALALLRRELDQGLATVNTLKAGLSQLADDVAALQQKNPTATPRAVWWPSLDQAAAAVAWQELSDWVRDVLLARAGRHERNRVLRACWRQHPDVVDELTALRIVWLHAYTNPTTAPTSATTYLGKYLPEAMARIETAFTSDGCTAGIHSAHKEPNHRPGRQWDREETHQFITADLAGRLTAQKD